MSEVDLSKIVNLIMNNPKLIEEIKNLSSQEKETEDAVSDTVEPKDVKTNSDEPITETVTYERKDANGGANRIRRKDLLLALKPYVSDERSRAIDSMMSIADIFEMMRSK